MWGKYSSKLCLLVKLSFHLRLFKPEVCIADYNWFSGTIQKFDRYIFYVAEMQIFMCFWDLTGNVIYSEAMQTNCSKSRNPYYWVKQCISTQVSVSLSNSKTLMKNYTSRFLRKFCDRNLVPNWNIHIFSSFVLRYLKRVHGINIEKGFQ